MTDVNIIFLLSLSVIAIGYFLKKANVISEENGSVIAKLIFNLTLPAIILKITSTINFEITFILLPIITIIFGILMTILGLILFKNYPRKVKGLLLMSIIGFNVANFSFPLIEGIWGKAGLQYIAMVDAGNAISIFVTCYIFGKIYSPKNENNNLKLKDIALSLVKSAPLMSYVIALTINFSGLAFPSFINDLLDIIGRANSLLSLLLLGTFLSFKFKREQWMMIIKSLLLRYLMGLTVGLLLFFLLPSTIFNHLFRLILTMSLILPIGLAVIPFSVELEYDQKLITMILNLSITISFGLLWIMILLLGV